MFRLKCCCTGNVCCLAATFAKRATASRGHVGIRRTHGLRGDNDKSTTVLRLLHSPLSHIHLVTMKRAREDCDGEPSTKVRRVIKLDRLSKLSDELLVRILSFVPVDSLLVCQRYNVIL